MLNFPKQTRRNNVGNINFRNSYITGVVREVESTSAGRYTVEIVESGESYPHIYTIENNPDYAVGDHVGILWEYGNREKPVICGILRNITYKEKSGSVNSLG
jgi:hypothetical protein